MKRNCRYITLYNSKYEWPDHMGLEWRLCVDDEGYELIPFGNAGWFPSPCEADGVWARGAARSFKTADQAIRALPDEVLRFCVLKGLSFGSVSEVSEGFPVDSIVGEAASVRDRLLPEPGLHAVEQATIMLSGRVDHMAGHMRWFRERKEESIRLIEERARRAMRAAPSKPSKWKKRLKVGLFWLAVAGCGALFGLADEVDHTLGRIMMLAATAGLCALVARLLLRR